MQAVEQRKKWTRFGDAVKSSEGDSVTAQSGDEIPFERVRQQKQTQEERKQDLKSVLQGSDKTAIVSKWDKTQLFYECSYVSRFSNAIIRTFILQ